MTNLLKISLISLLMIMTCQLDASHIRAGHIQIVKIQGNEVTFELVVYKDRGPAAELGGSFQFGDGTHLNNLRENAVLTIEVLNDHLEKVIYTINHIYQGPSDYIVSFEESYRNSAILNIENSAGTTFYVETTFSLDPFFGENIYPEILVENADAFVGNSFTFAPIVKDSDRDLLLFSLVTPKQGRVMPVINFRYPNDASFYSEFEMGNSQQNGPPTFSIDQYTGTISWDAPGDEIGNGTREYTIAYRLSEWREISGNYYLLSSTLVDQLVIVLDNEPDFPDIKVEDDLCISESLTLTIQNTGEPLTLEVDLPFLVTEDGKKINTLNGLIINSDTIIEMGVNPASSEDQRLGQLRLRSNSLGPIFSQNIPNPEYCGQAEIVLEASNRDESLGIIMYPNPSTGRIKIESDKNLSALKIVSLSGRILYEQNLQYHSVTLNLEGLLQNGLYLIQFYDENRRLLGAKELVIVN